MLGACVWGALHRFWGSAKCCGFAFGMRGGPEYRIDAKQKPHFLVLESTHNKKHFPNTVDQIGQIEQIEQIDQIDHIGK